jgi:hypothetical protein
MARALTKVDRRGKLYTRPGEVDTAIEVAIKQDLDTLAQRAWISHPDKAEFLPMECLVHLLRDAGRRRDDHALRALMPPLLARCENVLRAKIPDNSFPNALEIREDILGEFSLLFVEDAAGENSSELDFYECRFFRAFLVFRFGYLRRERARLNELIPLPTSNEPDSHSSDEDVFARVSEAFRSQPTQVGKLLEKDLIKAINNLPPDERKAIVLCHVLGLKEESEDPSAVTAARLCGVSGRTVRNRLTRAAKKLSQFKKGESL